MKVIVDRFEGGVAVCEGEDGKMVYVKRVKLPTGVKEGDVLVVLGDVVKVDRAETEKRRKEVGELVRGFWK